MSSDSTTLQSSYSAQNDSSAAQSQSALSGQGVKSRHQSQGPSSQERSGVPSAQLPVQIPALATTHLHEREVLLTEEDSDLQQALNTPASARSSSPLGKLTLLVYGKKFISRSQEWSYYPLLSIPIFPEWERLNILVCSL